MRGRIFIVGIGRSGTSLLQSMLASHPLIYFIPETSFLRRYLLRYDQPDFILKRFIFKKWLAKKVNNDPKIKRLSSMASVNLDSHILHEKLDLKAFFNDFYKLSGDAKYLGDKDPRLVESIDKVRRKFPESKFVYIYRDPRAVIASRKNAHWASNNLIKSLAVTRYQYIVAAKFLSLFPSVIHAVKYESLLTNPSLELSKIADFLDIEFCPSMLAFTDESHRLVQDDEMQWKKDTLGPINTKNIDKWKHSLSTTDISIIEKSLMSLGINSSYLTSVNDKQTFVSDIYINLHVLVVKCCSYFILLYRRFF